MVIGLRMNADSPRSILVSSHSPSRFWHVQVNSGPSQASPVIAQLEGSQVSKISLKKNSLLSLGLSAPFSWSKVSARHFFRAEDGDCHGTATPVYIHSGSSPPTSSGCSVLAAGCRRCSARRGRMPREKARPCRRRCHFRNNNLFILSTWSVSFSNMRCSKCMWRSRSTHLHTTGRTYRQPRP